jgi:hypothetical protein
MADQVTPTGRLIAVDGSRGKDVDAAAGALAAGLQRAGVDCAISRWDASGLFAELAAAARDDRNVSVRSLALVYAADLAFRLRWEIRPVLESGGTVIAAGYIETPVAFGVSCGLGEEWLRQLLRFAPSPHLRGRAEERKIDRPWKRRLDRGYTEYCALMLEASAPGRASKKARRAMMAGLAQARGKKKTFTLTPKGIAGLVAAVTDSRPAAPSGSRARSRTSRT